ncbi:MAG TPA: rhomboid family intramembrane serine protease [Gemmatimonadaceae bacterium]|jgi:membrane associated rhomboid family serine protease|nr:rhomboid family intramembrane serine protease [Gemmatimonadaceae bacterium]
MSVPLSSPVDPTPRNGVTPAVAWLIAANVGIYFLQVALFGAENVANWFSLSSETFPGQWWAIATYMFVHANLLHIATNMFTLWMFGPRIERVFGTRSFTYFYFWCGLGGAIFQLLFVRNSAVIGASGAVVGVVLAYALRWPTEEVYLFGVIPMQTRWLAIWMLAVNVGMALATMTGYSNSTTAWMTHVGGLAFAWLYLNAPLIPSLERIHRHVSTVPDTSDPHPIPRIPRSHRHTEEGGERQTESITGTETPHTVDEVLAQSNALITHQPSPTTIMPTAPKAPEHADAINTLLDKISRHGIDSLTPIERQLLEDVSRRLRNS